MNSQKRKRKAPRLNHKKSKAGCQRCKARRVKCDEVHPVCGGCERHEVECVWATEAHDEAADLNGASNSTPSISSQNALSTPADSSASPGLATPTASESAERRLLELHLLHNFTTRTVPVLPGANDPLVKDLWITEAPAVAIAHPPLLSAMLAASAFHLAFLQPREVAKYVAIAQDYTSHAVRHHQAAIAALGPATADAVTLTSILMSLLTLRDLPAYAFEQSGQPHAESSTPPASQFQRLVFIQGTHATIGRAWEGSVADSSPILQVMLQHLPQTWDQRRAARQETGHKPQSEEPILPEGYVEAVQMILAPRIRCLGTTAHSHHATRVAPMVTELQDDSLVQLYAQAIEQCTSVLRSVVSGEYEPSSEAQLVCTACAMLPQEFMGLVQEGRPRAMIIVAHLWGLMRSCRDMFWIGDMAIRDTNVIATELGEEWRPYLKWLLHWVEEQPD